MYQFASDLCGCVWVYVNQYLFFSSVRSLGESLQKSRREENMGEGLRADRHDCDKLKRVKSFYDNRKAVI